VLGGLLVDHLVDIGRLDWPGMELLLPWQRIMILVGLPGIALALVTFHALQEPKRTSWSTPQRITEL